jgi:death-on-curing family protein
MSDEALRQLERDWENSGTQEAETAYLGLLMRLSPPGCINIALAAFLGHPAAISVTTVDIEPEPTKPHETAEGTDPLQSWFLALQRHGGTAAALRAALVAARCVLRRWTSRRAQDGRPAHALRLAELTLLSRNGGADGDLERAAEGAAAAAEDSSGGALPTTATDAAKACAFAATSVLENDSAEREDQALDAIYAAHESSPSSEWGPRSSVRRAIEQALIPWALGRQEPAQKDLERVQTGESFATSSRSRTKKTKRSTVHYVTGEEVFALHNQLVEFFSVGDDPISPAGARAAGLVQSACERPKTSLGNHEKYRSVCDKAAAFFHSLNQNHGFHNGNKRVALVATIDFLQRNRRRLTASDDELFEICVAVADHRFPPDRPNSDPDTVVNALSRWFRANSERRSFSARGMKNREFIRRCVDLGCEERIYRNRSCVTLRSPYGQVIEVATLGRLTGPHVKRKWSKLGLESATGIYLEEFTDKIRPDQDLLRRFRRVLKRLAHA